MNDEDFDIEKELEDQDDYDSQWELAYDKWEEEGDRSMLENLVQQKSSIHQLDTFEKLKKKGDNLDYGKSDAALTSIILTSAWFLLHPIIISLSLLTGYKIFQHSKRQVEDTDNFWERLDQFGFELFYFIFGSLATIYFFVELQNQSIVLSDGGTFMQLLAVVYNNLYSLVITVA